MLQRAHPARKRDSALVPPPPVSERPFVPSPRPSQAEREARLSSERRVEHLSRRIIGLEATTHAMSKVTALLPRLEQALDSQLVITPGTAPTSAMAPAGPAVNRARTPSLAANRAASEAVALANDLGAMRLVLSLDETLGSILSHLDSRSVSWLAPVAHVWAAASRGVLLERRLLFVFGSIDVFASALLRPNDGGCVSPGRRRRQPHGDGSGNLFTTSDGFLCCASPMPLRDDVAGEQEPPPPPPPAGSAAVSASSTGPSASAVSSHAAAVRATTRPSNGRPGSGRPPSTRPGSGRPSGVSAAASGSSASAAALGAAAAGGAAISTSAGADGAGSSSGAGVSSSALAAAAVAAQRRPLSPASSSGSSDDEDAVDEPHRRPPYLATRSTPPPLGDDLLDDGFFTERGGVSSAKAAAAIVRASLVELACVYGGTDYCLLLTRSGRVLTFGTAVHGRLGYEISAEMGVDANGDPYQPTPALVTGGGLAAAHAVSAVVSELHTAVLTDDGRLFTWGSNSFGNLGYAECEPISERASSIRIASAGGALCQRVPRQVVAGGLGLRRIVAIAASDYSTLAVTDSGELFSWGSAVYGQLGYPVSEEMETDSNGSPYQLTPRLVDGGSLKGSRRKRASPVVAATCSNLHSVVLTADGAVHAFGCACAGKLGMEAAGAGLTAAWDGLVYEPTPRRVRGELLLEQLVHAECSDYHTAVISAAGELWVWGCAVYGKLGFMPTEACAGFVDGTPYEPTPTRVGGGLRGRRVVQALCSSVHTAAVTADGILWTWGSTLYGSLGYPPTAAMPVDANNFPYQPRPSPVPLPNAELKVLRIKSEVYEPPTDDSLCPCSTKSCTVVLTTHGVYTFGLADDGGLGYAPLPEMSTTVIGGYSRKCQWRPRLVPVAWSIFGHGRGRRDPSQWSEAELNKALHQVAITPTSTLVIAAPAAPAAPNE